MPLVPAECMESRQLSDLRLLRPWLAHHTVSPLHLEETSRQSQISGSASALKRNASAGKISTSYFGDDVSFSQSFVIFLK